MFEVLAVLVSNASHSLRGADMQCSIEIIFVAYEYVAYEYASYYTKVRRRRWKVGTHPIVSTTAVEPLKDFFLDGVK